MEGEWFFFEVPDTVRTELLKIAGPNFATLTEAITAIWNRMDRAAVEATKAFHDQGEGIIRRGSIRIRLESLVLQDIIERRHQVIEGVDVLVYPADVEIPDFDHVESTFDMPFLLQVQALPAYIVYNGKVYPIPSAERIEFPAETIRQSPTFVATTSKVSITVREIYGQSPMVTPFEWFEGVRRFLFHMKEMIDAGNTQQITLPKEQIDEP